MYLSLIKAFDKQTVKEAKLPSKCDEVTSYTDNGFPDNEHHCLTLFLKSVLLHY